MSAPLLVAPEHPNLALTHFSGRDELSRPFHYRVQFLSEDPLNPEDFLGQPFHFQIHQGQEPAVDFHGFVYRFGRSEGEGQQYYFIELAPWFFYLQRSAPCRFFKNKNVPDIFSEVCRELGFYDFDLSGLTKSYPPKEYLAQVHETSFDFLSRLLEEVGIFYYFTHEAEKHTMHLVDDFSRFPVISKEISFFELREKHVLKSNLISESQSLLVKNYCEAESAVPVLSAGFSVLRPAGSRRFARDDKGMSVNFSSIMMAGEPCFIIRVDHRACDARLLGESLEYENKFIVVSAKSDLSLEARPAPMISGVHTAVVSSGLGKNNGAVQVRFHWNPDDDACWMRVAQQQVSLSSGQQWMPQCGDEVLVEYVDGNLNEPHILGSLYNGENRLPASEFVTGFKTASSHVYLNDTPDQEHIHLQASSLLESVQNDYGIEASTLRKNTDGGVAIEIGEHGVFSAEQLCFSAGASQLIMNAGEVNFRGDFIHVIS